MPAFAAHRVPLVLLLAGWLSNLVCTSPDIATEKLVNLDAPRIKMEIPRTPGLVNSKYILQCFATGSPKPTISWIKDEHEFVPGTFEEVLGNGTLIIHNLTINHTGTYGCIAKNYAGTDEAKEYIEVGAAPQFVKNKEEITIYVFENKYLPCDEHMGHPPPIVTLSRTDGKSLSQRFYFNGSCVIQLTGARREDQGTYVLEAKNKYGTSSKELKINIKRYEKPILGPDSDEVAVEGKCKELTCPLQKGYPLPIAKWYKDGIYLYNTNLLKLNARQFTNRSLIISDIRSTHKGLYECRAFNRQGEDRRRVNLTVLTDPPPHVSTPEQMDLLYKKRGEIPCQVNSILNYTVKWTKQDKSGSMVPVKGTQFTVKSSGSLIFSSVEKSDQGLYRCIAQSLSGENSDDVFVNVIEPVHVTVSTGKQKLKMNGAINLHCRASGSPVITLQWIKNGALLKRSDPLKKSEENELSLRIGDGQKSHAGIYMCKGYNKLSTDKASVEIEYLEPPKIKLKTPTFPSLIGSKYILHCIATGSPEPIISWTMNGTKLVSGMFSQVFKNGSLIINELTSSHTGLYSCEAKNEAGEDSVQVPIDVGSIPWFDANKEDTDVEVHTCGTIQCTVHGDPDPRVQWSRLNGSDKLPIRFSMRSSCSLHLRDAQPEDDGTYTVTAKNKYGSKSKTFRIHITGIEKPVLAPSSKEVVSIAGKRKELPCQLQKGYPSPTVKWLKDGVELDERRLSKLNIMKYPNRSIIISDTKPSSQGMYECRVSNIAGEDKMLVKLTVHSVPHIIGGIQIVMRVKNGESIVLPCHAIGFPKPTITWTKDGKSIPSSLAIIISPKNRLYISSATMESNGTYECVAENSAGKNKKRINLFVIFSPPHVNTPQQVDLLYKQGAEIPCHVHSTLNYTVKWKKQNKSGSMILVSGTRFTVKPSGSLILSSVGKLDQGLYRCIAQSLSGENSDDVFVNVIEPVHVTVPTEKQKLKVNGAVNLHCHASGSPIITLQWIKNGTVLKRSDPQKKSEENELTLRFADGQKSHAGVYICIARNALNTDKASVEIEYLEPPKIKLKNSTFRSLAGSKYILQCIATGSPEPIISWTMNGTKLVSGKFAKVFKNGSLIINKLSSFHTGLYSCQAENEAGEDSVQVPIDVGSIPWFDTNKEDTHIKMNASGTIQCSVHGHPDPSVQWSRLNGSDILSKRFSMGPSCTLHIRDAHPEDDGTYTVTAKNKYGSKTKTFKIHITGISAECDAAGSLHSRPDPSGRCRCKEYVTGDRCQQCVKNTFHLDASNPDGCIPCFCMGITDKCSSSNWYRQQISSTFTRDTNDFHLVESYKKDEPIRKGIQLNAEQREIVFSGCFKWIRFRCVQWRSSSVLYWKLPSQFLGDKITAYGGKLRYTLRYVPAPDSVSSRNNVPDVELISTNDIHLRHFSHEQISPERPQTLEVPLLEQYWQRIDGQPTDRYHLLMTLADLEAIYIKATYTTYTRETSLSEVSLDIAEELNTGQNLVLEVEQCTCPKGYQGLSCQDCDVGYTRTDHGLYLGTCEACDCNGFSEDCDPETGVCTNCRDNTAGLQCEGCADGFTKQDGECIHESSSLDPCRCDPRGIRQPGCPDGRSCICKTNVEGLHCDRCRRGTFDLSARRSEGCIPCWCSGVTDQCKSSRLQHTPIAMQLLSGTHGFTLVDIERNPVVHTGFSENVAENELGYDFRGRDERLFWSLSSQFTGNKLASYGGNISVTQRYTARPGSQWRQDTDILIFGNGIRIYWSGAKTTQPDLPVTHVIPLVEHEWQRLVSIGPRPATRVDLLTVLSDIDAILIRAKPATHTLLTFISNVSLDTAVKQTTNQGSVTNIEICLCPPGYRGTSCESCSVHYYRKVQPDGRFSCEKCPCNDNEEGCSAAPNGDVVCRCVPGFTGRYCDNRDSRHGLNLKTYPDKQIIFPSFEGQEVALQCRDEGPLRARVHWLRGNGLPLPPGSRHFNGRLEIPGAQMDHSGTYICEALGVPPNTPGRQVSVHLTVESFPTPEHRPIETCAIHEATCLNGECVNKTVVCDGYFDCSDGSDESRCIAGGCEPNEFRCSNEKCVLKHWRCDGDDCGDSSDEENCPTNPPGSPCRYNDFQCHRDNQCVPRAFQCDHENDCLDGSDENGCSSVLIASPPPPKVVLDQGSEFTVTCKALGVPTPEVVWRLHWGHVPAKCRMESVGGVGKITCPDIQPQDQGVYSCEAINTRGSVFAVPDSILVVKTPSSVCQRGYFNDLATIESDCISCFCFGTTAECKSADLFTYQLSPPITQYVLVKVNVGPDVQVNVPLSTPFSTAPGQTVSRTGFQIYHSGNKWLSDNEYLYFALPANYLGNHLKSYGGYVKYTVRPEGRGSLLNIPDIILAGSDDSNYMIWYYADNIELGRDNNVSARFFYGQWKKPTFSGRPGGDPSSSSNENLASREEIMRALSNVDYILIRGQYVQGPDLNTTFSNIRMDSAGITNTGQGQASFVESCSCPAGHTGLSCEIKPEVDDHGGEDDCYFTEGGGPSF